MDSLAEELTRLLVKTRDPIIRQVASWAMPESWIKGNPVLPRLMVNELLMHPDLQDLEFTSRIGFVTPSREMIETVKDVMATHETGRIVEVGAGQGYLSAMFRLAGIETTATDLQPNELLRYCAIKPLDASIAVRTHADDAVLMSWPQPNSVWGLPSLVGLQVIHAMKPGNLLLYIHGYDDGLFPNEPQLIEAIKRNFEQIGTKLPLPMSPRDEGNSLRVFRKLDKPHFQ